MAFFRKHKKKLLLLFILLMTAIAAIGQEMRQPVIEYYGQMLSPAEFMVIFNEREARGEYLYCSQVPNVEDYLAQTMNRMICFNTERELAAYREIARREMARIEALFPDYEFPAPPEGYDSGQPESSMTLSANHWALFAHSFYNGWLKNVHNNTSCASTTSGIWSIWKDGIPNTPLKLFGNTNCIGTSVEIYNNTGFCWSWPFGCGGTRGARVP